MADSPQNLPTFLGLPMEMRLTIYNLYSQDLINTPDSDPHDYDLERLASGEEGHWQLLEPDRVLQSNEPRSPGKLFVPSSCPVFPPNSRTLEREFPPVLAQYAKAFVSTTAESRCSRSGHEYTLYRHSSAIRLYQPPESSDVRHLQYHWLIYLDVHCRDPQNRQIPNRLDILKHHAPKLRSLVLDIRIDSNYHLNRNWEWMIRSLTEDPERHLLLQQITDLNFPELRTLMFKGVFLGSWLDKFQAKYPTVQIFRGKRCAAPIVTAEGTDVVELCWYEEKLWLD